ncbi:MAG TPA: hypothetical protein VFG76_07985, partial [Candidatus Polarisedimenticolia bacterium]|nr:hypothetical protein [Candidatus Polarisedimenticolia bacterium]
PLAGVRPAGRGSVHAGAWRRRRRGNVRTQELHGYVRERAVFGWSRRARIQGRLRLLVRDSGLLARGVRVAR